jgi:hypothetical protein
MSSCSISNDLLTPDSTQAGPCCRVVERGVPAEARPRQPAAADGRVAQDGRAEGGATGIDFMKLESGRKVFGPILNFIKIFVQLKHTNVYLKILQLILGHKYIVHEKQYSKTYVFFIFIHKF